MRQGEFPQFESLIRQLEGVYGKKIDDAAMQLWWRALRDLPFDVVKHRVESHIRYAKFFPKPMELRPKEERPKEVDQGEEKRFAALNAQSARNWDERLKFDPLATKWVLLEAYVARLDVQHSRDSVEYAEKMAFAREAYQRLRAQMIDAQILSIPNGVRVVGVFDPHDFQRVSSLVTQKVAA